MDAADPEDEQDAFIFRPAKKSKADLKAEAEARANARCKEYCKEKSKDLTAVVRRWGCASWVFRSPEPLWQIQVRHVAHPQAAFGDGLISTACRALVHHPAAEIHDLKTLFKEAKVKVLAGAPPEPGKGSTDPDRVGILDWVPVLYVAGAGPLEGLTVIKLVMEEKVRMGLNAATSHIFLALGTGNRRSLAASRHSSTLDISSKQCAATLATAGHLPSEPLLSASSCWAAARACLHPDGGQARGRAVRLVPVRRHLLFP